MLTQARKEQIIKLCQELICQPSYSGQEDKIVKIIQEKFKKLGYDDWMIDAYGNVMGHLNGKEPGKTIVLDGHIDTVPVTDVSKWVHDPFGGEIVAGKIYGRGASDMKGAVSAMIAAAAYFADDVNRNFAGDLYVACVVHEECFEGIAARKISEALNPDYVVIGEASELNLKRGQRGRAEIVVETFGKPSHSANPEKGVNAVYSMAELIQRIQHLKVSTHEILGQGILVLTDIKSSPYPGASVVPDYCRATFDRRILVGETKESVLEPIAQLIVEMEKENPTFKAKVSYAVGTEQCYTGESIEGERFFPGWLFDEKEEFVQAALEGLREAGLAPQITQYSFCTNGSHYAGEKGIKTIGFGPSRENLAHTMDEYVEIDQLWKAAEGYYAIIKSLL
ncbi:MAG: YgeY family selenium metabolism-linked hydrolase [Bacillota bacterium]|nr:YgeY family selenium metabolism-linked hydrolase [Bacillota bacterium]